MTLLRSNVAVKREQELDGLQNEECLRSPEKMEPPDRPKSPVRAVYRKEREIIMWDEV